MRIMQHNEEEVMKKRNAILVAIICAVIVFVVVVAAFVYFTFLAHKDIDESNNRIEEYVAQTTVADETEPTVLYETEVDDMKIKTEISYITSDNPVQPTDGAQYGEDELSQKQEINPDFNQVADELEGLLIDTIPEYLEVVRQSGSNNTIELYVKNLNKIGYNLDTALIYVVEQNGEYTVYPELADIENILAEKGDE